MNDYDETPSESLKLAEQSTLGGMMLSKRAVADCIEIVTPTDFADWRHELIARAIFELFTSGQPTDVIAVTDELGKRDELARVGIGYLHELTSLVPTAANAGYYAEIVEQGAIKRRVIEAAARMTQQAQRDGDAHQLLEDARSELDAATTLARVETTPIADGLEATVQGMREQPRFIPTPWDKLNDLIGGLRPGTLNVIGARPGSGKTIMGLQLAAKMAGYGSVAFSSLEMSTTDLTKRMFAMLGTVHMSAISRNALTPNDWKIIEALRPQIARMPLFIDDKPGVGIAHVRAHARSVSRRAPLACVVVDYLQLMESPERSKRPRWEVVGEFSRGLKLLSRELDVPVVALAQLNRENTGAGLVRRAPSMSDLRESGNIEQDADTIVLLQRGVDIDDSGAEVPSDELEVHVVKNRHGQQGQLALLWEGQFARVSNTPW